MNENIPAQIITIKNAMINQRRIELWKIQSEFLQSRYILMWENSDMQMIEKYYVTDQLGAIKAYENKVKQILKEG